MEDIETAPALHRLRIGNRSIVQVKAGIWRRLTHLELPSLENLKLMGVLKQSSNLQELRVAVFSHHFPDIVPVLLSNLTDRYIHAQDSMYTPFLRLIEALSLQHLNIHRPRHYINGEVSDLHDFHDFVWRSQCDLRRLALDDAFLSGSGVAKFFGPLASLELLQELVVREMIGDETIVALSLSENGIIEGNETSTLQDVQRWVNLGCV